MNRRDLDQLVDEQLLRGTRLTLAGRLRALRSELAAAAQGVLDEWEQDEEGLDEELGAGGVCDKVADAMDAVIGQHLPDVTTTEGGQEGGDHAYLVVYTDNAACRVDIDPYVYETGGGYSWRKRPGVRLVAEHVEVDSVPREWIET